MEITPNYDVHDNILYMKWNSFDYNVMTYNLQRHFTYETDFTLHYGVFISVGTNIKAK